ncbi:VanZ family protein [Candidatus Woesebacteria bacterium]|nr:VanZ family protein [Candidatus Woesebacteria bacterium]
MRKTFTKISEHYAIRWMTLTLWCSLIFFLSSQSVLPGAPSGVVDFVFKKTAHMTVYAVLYLFALRAFSSSRTQEFKRAAIFTLFFAVSDEFHQSFVPGRTPHPMDIGFDTLGMLAMWGTIKKYSWQ